MLKELCVSILCGSQLLILHFRNNHSFESHIDSIIYFIQNQIYVRLKYHIASLTSTSVHLGKRLKAQKKNFIEIMMHKKDKNLPNASITRVCLSTRQKHQHFYQFCILVGYVRNMYASLWVMTIVRDKDYVVADGPPLRWFSNKKLVKNRVFAT